jgi:hypothetical protein
MATLPQVLINRADYQIGGGVALRLRTQETDKRRGGSRVALEVSSETPIVTDPREREALQFIALDDCELPGAGLGDGGRPLRLRVSEDTPDEGEEAAKNLANIHLAPMAAALGRRDHRVNQRPFAISQIARISQTMPLGGAAMLRFPHLGTPRSMIRVPQNESQMIQLTQQLSGSALRGGSIGCTI